MFVDGGVAHGQFSFTVVSPIIGAAVMEYLETTDGVRVGAIAGEIAVIPVLWFGLVFLGLFAAPRRHPRAADHELEFEFYAHGAVGSSTVEVGGRQRLPCGVCIQYRRHRCKKSTANQRTSDSLRPPESSFIC